MFIVYAHWGVLRRTAYNDRLDPCNCILPLHAGLASHCTTWNFLIYSIHWRSEVAILFSLDSKEVASLSLQVVHDCKRG